MTRQEIDTLWFRAMHESIKNGEGFTRYHFAALVAAIEREALKKLWEELTLTDQHIAEVIKASIDAEREACAKVCDEQGRGRKALEHYAALTYSGATHDCAAAIRARGEK